MDITEGTPQGGPLSSLLANILLDELDKELEKRGHKFVRYADDCNIYVKSKRAGERVMESVKRYLQERLKLKITGLPEQVVHEFANARKGPWRLAHGPMNRPWATPTGNPRA